MSPPPGLSPEQHAPPRRSRLDSPELFARTGEGPRLLEDLFHRLMTATWPGVFAFLLAGFVAFNALFAGLYLALGDAISSARPGSFEDAFFFSVQTMATIGYGVMTPRGTLANALVVVEAFGGMMATAITTGLVFAKFGRPTARVRFANAALVGRLEGKRVRMVRLANERRNRIMEASAHVVLLRDELSAEGLFYRRVVDLPLQRDRSVMFVLSWTLLHTLDESSPLYGETPESLARANASPIASVSGTDEALMQAVHARKAYDADAVLFGASFADIFVEGPGGRGLDLDRLHDYRLEHPSSSAEG
ncbi:MAG: ATP-sensitive inward rectifier potassium channel 10 [Deltaproteobacteria bacterium]|nr:ATP-sensitive inward rectifier potassium channel 10 [Deltaproteobacteria bacterium]